MNITRREILQGAAATVAVAVAGVPTLAAAMSDETVTCIEMNGGEMAELRVGVQHVDGRKYYRAATWADVRKVERELPGWKDKLRPGDGPNLPVPYFSTKELD